MLLGLFCESVGGQVVLDVVACEMGGMFGLKILVGEKWRTSRAVHLTKVRWIRRLKDLRVVTICGAMVELYRNCLARRLDEATDKCLSTFQAGGRRRFQAQGLLRVIRQVWENACVFYMLYIIVNLHFKHAYDTPHHLYILRTLQCHMVDPQLSCAILLMYLGSALCVSYPDCEMPIRALRGFRQGMLESVFFIFVLDYCMSGVVASWGLRVMDFRLCVRMIVRLWWDI